MEIESLIEGQRSS